MQPTFDFLPAPKRIAETSVEVYRAIAPSLPTREQAVLDALSVWDGTDPTAYELFEFMRGLRLVSDLNAVRPRLTALYDKGRVIRSGKRACLITGRTAYTWRVK